MHQVDAGAMIARRQPVALIAGDGTGRASLRCCVQVSVAHTLHTTNHMLTRSGGLASASRAPSLR